MRIFLAIATSLILSVLALDYYVRDDDIVEYYRDRAVLAEVCELLALDCSQVDEPIVVITRLVPSGAYGMYFHGERYIFIAYGNPKRYHDIEIHETTHYVITKLGIDMSKCDSERVARAVTATLTDTEVDPGWEKRYGCTTLGEGS